MVRKKLCNQTHILDRGEQESCGEKCWALYAVTKQLNGQRLHHGCITNRLVDSGQRLYRSKDFYVTAVKVIEQKTVFYGTTR